MLVESFHHKTFVLESTEEELKTLEKCCTIYKKNYGAPGKKPIITRLYDSNEKSFPTPYVEHLATKLDKLGVDIERIDSRVYPGQSLRLDMPKKIHEPWEHQAHTIEKIDNHPTGVCIGETGSGKALIADYCVIRKKVRTLIITHSTDVKNQYYYRYVDYWGKEKVATEVSKIEGQLTSGEFRKSNKSYSRGYDIYEDVKDPEGDEYDQYLKRKGFKQCGNKLYKVKKAEQSDHGFLKGKKRKKKATYPDIVITCFQGLDSLPLDYLETVELVIVDEGDTSACASIRENLLLMSNAAYRYIFSATYFRNYVEDMELLVASTGNIILSEFSGQKAENSGLVKKTVLHQLDSRYTHNRGQELYLRDVKGAVNVRQTCIVANRTRNKIIAEVVYELFHIEKKRIFIAVHEVEHIILLQKEMDLLGLPSIFYASGMKREDKEEKKEIISNGTDPLILIGTSAISKGSDTRNIDTVFLADLAKDLVKAVQAIGRGKRMANDETVLDVYYFHDHLNDTTLRWSSELHRELKKYVESGEGSSYTEDRFKKSKIELIRK